MGIANLFAVPEWFEIFSTVRIVLLSLIVLLCIGLIIVVMIQPSNQQGTGSLTGQSDTFYSKNKSKTMEGFLKKLTVIIACALFVLSILFLVTLIFYVGK